MTIKSSKQLNKVEEQLNQDKQRKYVKDVLEADLASNQAKAVKDKVAKLDVYNLDNIDKIGQELEERSNKIGEILGTYQDGVNNEIKGVSELKSLAERELPDKVVKRKRGWLPKLNIFHLRDNWIAKAENRIIDIDSKVTQIAANIDKRVEDRKQAARNLEKASEYNKETAIQITYYIKAIEDRLASLNDNELEEAKQRLMDTKEGTPAHTKALENYRDLLKAVDRLKIRQADLATQRQVLLTIAEELRINRETIDRVILQAQRAKTTTVQTFKVSAHTQLENLRSARDGEAYAGLMDASRKMLVQTNQNSNVVLKNIAEENNKAIIDAQVFQDLLKANIDTNEEVRKLDERGRQARDKNLKELEHLNQEQKLASVKDVTNSLEEGD